MFERGICDSIGGLSGGWLKPACRPKDLADLGQMSG